MSASPDRTWDVAVVGAGPAGAMCAYDLARRGHSVVLLDLQSFPRDKACGDFLIGDALHILDELGFREEVDRFAQHSRRLSVRYQSELHIELRGTFTTLSRRLFDNFLFEKAIMAGAAFQQVRAQHLAQAPSSDFMTITTQSGLLIKSRFAVVASGADSLFTRKALRLASPGANAFAFRKYVVSRAEIHDAIIVYHPFIQPGYGWIIPVDHDGEGNRYNVGAGWPLDGVDHSRNIDVVMDTVLVDVPEAKDLYAHLLYEDSWRGAPLKCGLTLDHCIINDRTVAIGEAVGTTYPFTGEGIGKAMLSGLYAADAMHEALVTGDTGKLLSYPHRLKTLVARYDAFAQIEKLLTRPSTSRFLLNRLRRSPYLMQIADDVFHQDISPAPLLKPLNILKSFWQ